jgi:hypothetical protein
MNNAKTTFFAECKFLSPKESSYSHPFFHAWCSAEEGWVQESQAIWSFYYGTTHKKIEQSISPTPLFSIVGELQSVLWIRTFFGFFGSEIIITDPWLFWPKNLWSLANFILQMGNLSLLIWEHILLWKASSLAPTPNTYNLLRWLIFGSDPVLDLDPDATDLKGRI